MAHDKNAEYQARVAAAYSAAGVLKLLAWVVVGVSLAVAAGTVFELATGGISLEAAFAALAGTALAGVLSGGTAYASAVGVGLGAARLEHAIGVTQAADDEAPVDLEL